MSEPTATGREPVASGQDPSTDVARERAQVVRDVVDVRTGMFGVRGTGDTSGYGGLVRAVSMPVHTPRPYGGWFDEVVDVLAEVLDTGVVAGGPGRGADRARDGAPDGPPRPDDPAADGPRPGGPTFAEAIEGVVVDRGELTLHVRREHLVPVCRALRDDRDLRFELSLGVSGVHYPHDAGRELRAVYHLTSVTHGRSLRLEVSAPDADPRIPSTVSVYPANDWHERETWDFFGLVFEGHPALARIEMPDDWPGHPQRKDYPLGGIEVEYKGATVPPPDRRRSYS